MGKLISPFQIRGTVGNITFAKTKHGVIAKGKSAISASRIASNPPFTRIRQNNHEFRTAATAGKLLRLAFGSAIINAKDYSHSNRLMKRMMEVLKTDLVHPAGERTVAGGDLTLLEGFEFNQKAQLVHRLFMQPEISFHRGTGELKVEFRDFIPDKMISSPEGSTHVKLVLAGALVNFTDLNFETGKDSGAELSMYDSHIGSFDLSVSLAPNSRDPLFVAIGLEFYKLAGTVYYPLKNGNYNAMRIVKVVV